MKIGKTQQEIADAAGVSQPYVSALLKRKKKGASDDVALRLAKASNISFHFWRSPELFDHAGNPLSPATPPTHD